jgi:hypothetical protein
MQIIRIICKPTMIKNAQANAICECIHQVLETMMCTSELDMAESVDPAGIEFFCQQCSVGYSLYIPHSIKSLTRCSNLWM